MCKKNSLLYFMSALLLCFAITPSDAASEEAEKVDTASSVPPKSGFVTVQEMLDRWSSLEIRQPKPQAAVAAAPQTNQANLAVIVISAIILLLVCCCALLTFYWLFSVGTL